MKTLFLILLFCTLQSVQASQQGVSELPKAISITLENSDSPRECTQSGNSKVYLCFSLKENFVFLNENPYKVIDLSDPQNLRYSSLKKVQANKQVIYQDTLPSELVSLLDATKITNKETKDTVKDKFFKINQIKQDFEKFKNIPDPRIKAALIELPFQYYKAEQKYQEALSSDKITISLRDHTEQTCIRLPSSSPSVNCGVFECKNPKNAAEKNLIIYDQEFYPSVLPMLQTMKNGQLVPSSDVLKVSHAKNKSLLADVEAVIDNPEDTYNQRIKDAQKILKSSMPQMAKNYAYLKDYFVIEYRQTQMLSCKDVPLLRDFRKATDNLFNKVANIPLAILVDLIGGNLIEANYVDRALAAETHCRVNGVYISPDSLDAIDYLKSALSTVENSPKDFIDLETAYRLFDEARAMSDIAWNYKADGCYARAHLMARAFEKQGIHVDKAWLKGDLGIPEENIQWNYHVAPIVYVKDQNGKINPMIIDPSVFPTPVPLDSWVKKISQNSFPKLEKTNFPFPLNVELAHRTVLAISSSEPYTPMESINNTEETKMELARKTMEEYKELSESQQKEY